MNVQSGRDMSAIEPLKLVMNFVKLFKMMKPCKALFTVDLENVQRNRKKDKGKVTRCQVISN
jgi:hypothetical protein